MARKPKPRRGRKGPSFFKVLIDNFSSKLRIPSAFIYRFEGSVPQTCKLWTPAKRFWNVDLQKKDKRFFFQNGWSAFVEENSLEDRDFLLFYYNGNAEFFVEIYGQNCCQKEIFVATSESCEPPFYEEGNVDLQGMKGLAHGSGAKMSTESLTSQKKAAAIVVDAANKFTSRYPSFEVVMKPAYVRGGFLHIPKSFFKEHFKGSPRRITLRDSNELWPVKLIYVQTHGRISEGWLAFVKKNNLQAGDVCIFELIKKNDVLLKVSVRKCGS